MVSPELKEVVIDLITALERRHEVIADHAFRDRDPQAHLAALRDISEDIEKLSAVIPREFDPMLAHYLERRSYDKALAHLRGLYQS